MPHSQHPIELLRFNTCGSVDDGKSTLIGRLLYDSKSLMEDQIEALERSADITGGGQINLANLTDGLRAEREQGITIDVAYRYFATPKRKFIVADTPGHVQYTRNMVTGASTANLSVVLVDARQGVIEQTRRHTFIAALLGIPHLVIAVNKMDLVDWQEERFLEIRDEIEDFLPKLGAFRDVKFIPMSALDGDNVVDASTKTPWFEGPALLHHLETVHIASDRNLATLRFPVQWVNRPNNPTDKTLHDFRGLSGQIASGMIRKGQEVVVLPAGIKSRVANIWSYDRPLDEAFCPQSVTICLEHDIDISRGDMIVGRGESSRPQRGIAGASLLDARATVAARQKVFSQARHANRPGHRHQIGKPRQHDHARTGTRPGGAGDQRHRQHPHQDRQAACLRRLQHEPPDRLVHFDRARNECHRRRRNAFRADRGG